MKLNKDERISMTSSYNYYRLTKEIHRSSDPEDEAKCNALNSYLGDKYSSFKQLCMKLRRILRNYNDISLSNSNKSIKCLTLNMWMHEQIYDLLETNEQNIPRKIIYEIRDIWADYTPFTNCDILEELSKKRDFLENKKLFDYTINYDNIVMHLANKRHRCTQEYKDYIDEIQRIYNTQKGTHISQGNKVQCDILNNFEEINTKEKLEAVKCTKVQDRANNLIEESGEEIDGSPGEPGTPGQTGSRGRTYFQGPSPILPQAEGTSPTKSVTAGISLAGIPVFSYLLYKYTPVRTMFASRARRRNPIGSNMYGGEHYYMEDMYQMGNDIHPMMDNRIGYHPM
ncbi:VIR protein [Plasmodium vivax]|uniref:VIR protein n=1 Tax=Plasmodium vivax TaxID=5855 RepID=A0A1G4GVR0_PLAVI|nr:VIR protein [Plasmodium vivax]